MKASEEGEKRPKIVLEDIDLEAFADTLARAIVRHQEIARRRREAERDRRTLETYRFGLGYRKGDN